MSYKCQTVSVQHTTNERNGMQNWTLLTYNTKELNVLYLCVAYLSSQAVRIRKNVNVRDGNKNWQSRAFTCSNHKPFECHEVIFLCMHVRVHEHFSSTMWECEHVACMRFGCAKKMKSLATLFGKRKFSSSGLFLTRLAVIHFFSVGTNWY